MRRIWSSFFTLVMLFGVLPAAPAYGTVSGYIWLSKRTVPDWPLRTDGNFGRTTNFYATSLDGRYGLISAGSAHPSHPGGSDWTSIYLSDSVTGRLTLATTDEHGQKFPSNVANVNGVLSPHGTWMAWTNYDQSTTFTTVYVRDNQLGRVFRSLTTDTVQHASFVTDDGKIYGSFHTTPAAGTLIEAWDVPGAAVGALRMPPTQPGTASVAAMSGDGRTAVVVSGGRYFSYDIATSVTSLLPVPAPPGGFVNAVSQTGRYIGYMSRDPSLNPEGLTTQQVYLFDRDIGSTTWISAPGHGGRTDPTVNYYVLPRSISDDGRFVIFGADGVRTMPPLDPAHAGEPVLYFVGGTFERDVRTSDTRLVVADYAYGLAPNAGVVQFDTFGLDPADPPGDFDVYLSGPPVPRISAPSVTVTGISAGATYEFGATPTASCSVTDTIDGSSTFTATLSAPAGPRAGDGLGVVIASCTYTNSQGVSASSSVSYSIVDTTGPSISVPDGQQVEASGRSTAKTFAVTAVDLVDGSRPVSCDHPSGSGFPVGVTTVTCTSSDIAGNAGVAAFTVTVLDTTEPLLSLPASVTVAATSPAGASASYPAPSATDVVDGPLPVACDHASGAIFPLGVTVVSCAATDAAGNTISGSFTVHVQDRTAPVVTVPAALTVEATGPTGATVSYAGISAVDDVDGAITATCDHPSGNLLPLGVIVVTCTATDRAGNAGSSTFTVTTADTTAPTIAVPIHQTAEATGPLGAVVSFPAPTAQDIVDGRLTPSCSSSPGDQFGLGDTIVTCNATDAHGNTTSTSFTVTVTDTTGPVVTAPAPVREEATGPDGTQVNYGPASAIDTVDGPTPASCTPASGTIFRLGATTVSCIASDAHGNTTSISFPVTVVDSTSPVLTLPANQVANATSAAGAAVAFPAPTAVDVVDGTLTATCDHSPGATYPLGTTTITCTATDHASNTARGSFTVTVVDADAPTVAVPATLTAEATSIGGATVTYPAPTATDAIDGTLPVACDHPSGATYPLGTTTITCTATDHAGNTGTNTFTIRVIDTTPPTLTGATNHTATATSPNGATVAYSSPTATDLVDGNLPVTCSPPSGTTFALATTTITCTATDHAGNTGRTTFQITVAYRWSGPLPPLAEGATYQLGRTIPVKFALTDASTDITTATAHLWLTYLSNHTSAGEIIATSTSAATPGNTFRYDPTSNQYIFNLDTKTLDPGTWRLRIDLGDNTTHTTTITLNR